MKEANEKVGIVFVADHWEKVTGGIDVFNKHLCKWMAYVVDKADVSVVCLVIGDGIPTRQIHEADEQDITLVDYKIDGTESDEERCREAREEILEKVPCEKYIWIGHDLITGNMALTMSRLGSGVDKCAVLLHTDYFTTQAGRISSSSLDGQGCDGDLKNAAQEALAKQADWTFCVGPRLYQTFKNIHDTHQIIPGLDINNRKERSGDYNQIITSGRFDKKTEFQKRWLEVCDGIGKAIDLMVERGGTALDYTVAVYGFSHEYTDKELAELAESISNEVEQKTKNNVRISPKLYYFDDRQSRYLSNLSKSKVFVMSSWIETFGLVAWEAIEMGIPVVISRNSGVYMYMEEQLGYLLRGLCGSFTAGTKNSVEDMGMAIADILSGGKVEESAERLRIEMLKANRWETVAINMARILGIESVMSPDVYTDSPCIEFTYAKREMLLYEIKKRVQGKKIMEKIVFFDGISTRNILNDDSFLMHLIELLISRQGKQVHVYLAYPNDKAIGERISQIDMVNVDNVDEKALQMKSRRVSELKDTLFKIWKREKSYKAESAFWEAMQRIHLVPLDKSPTVYINILDSEWYYTNRYEKRASENSAMKLQLEGSEEGKIQKKNLIDYMKFILNASSYGEESQMMLKEIDKW